MLTQDPPDYAEAGDLIAECLGHLADELGWAAPPAGGEIAARLRGAGSGVVEKALAGLVRKAKGGFQRPENYDHVRDLDGGESLWGGANDWESGWTWAGVHAADDEKGESPGRWVNISHADCPGCKGTLNAAYGKSGRACQEYAKGEAEKVLGKTFTKAFVAPVRKAAEPERKHKFSSTHVTLPPEVGKRLAELARSIPDEDLGEDGREDDPHVTVLYGLV